MALPPVTRAKDVGRGRGSPFLSTQPRARSGVQSGLADDGPDEDARIAGDGGDDEGGGLAARTEPAIAGAKSDLRLPDDVAVLLRQFLPRHVHRLDRGPGALDQHAPFVLGPGLGDAAPRDPKGARIFRRREPAPAPQLPRVVEAAEDPGHPGRGAGSPSPRCGRGPDRAWPLGRSGSAGGGCRSRRPRHGNGIAARRGPCPASSTACGCVARVRDVAQIAHLTAVAVRCDRHRDGLFVHVQTVECCLLSHGSSS